MPGYVIADVTVTDPETYAGYRALTPGSIAAFDGRFLVRGGDKITLEGEHTDERIVIIQFDSVEAAQDMYDSPEYQAAIPLRANAAEAEFIVVAGSA